MRGEVKPTACPFGGFTMRRLFSAIMLAAMAITLVGCSKDDEIKSVVTEFNSFTTELVKKVESAPNPSVGVDEAQKYLDSKKTDIKAKLESIKGVRGFQVSKETTEQMTKEMTDAGMKVANLQVKYVSQSVKDPAFKAKVEKLTADYMSLLKME
jgi:hypothetical protein